MGNRADRRAEKKNRPKWQKLTSDQRINAMCKNGITPRDVDDAYAQGRKDAVDHLSDYITKTAVSCRICTSTFFNRYHKFFTDFCKNLTFSSIVLFFLMLNIGKFRMSRHITISFMYTGNYVPIFAHFYYLTMKIIICKVFSIDRNSSGTASAELFTFPVSVRSAASLLPSALWYVSHT